LRAALQKYKDQCVAESAKRKKKRNYAELEETYENLAHLIKDCKKGRKISQEEAKLLDDELNACWNTVV
jgi:hypothetical protein